VNEERMYKVILGAHISEKATVIADESNQVTLKVSPDATRPEIRQAVEVENVTVLNVKGKVKRNMRGTSRKPSWKKAYVRLAEGHEIDFADA
jgi:large subunit ribosomal protein L23